jgi:hypothetical protein
LSLPAIVTTTLVAPATNVVKLFPLTPYRALARARTLLLHERIEWVQRDLGAPDQPASLQVLADRASVTRQVLQQWVTKSKKGLSPGRGETFTRCARAWNVSLDWLQSGVGEPRASAYAPLEQALEADDWAPPAVAAAKAHYESGVRMSVAEWARYLRAVHDLTVRVELPGALVRAESTTKRTAG